VYKILEEAAPESAEVGLQFETRLYGHMAAVSGLLLSPEYRQRKMALSTLGFVNMETVLWIRIRICRIRMFLSFPDPLDRGTDSRIRIRTKMSRIHITARQIIVRIRSCICIAVLYNQYRMQVP
jgi:hypothetical protein